MSYDPTGRSGSASNNEGTRSEYATPFGFAMENQDMAAYARNRAAADKAVERSARGAGTGPGNGRVASGPVPGAGPGVVRVGKAEGKGPGNAVVAAGPLKQKTKSTVTQLQLGTSWWQSNPWFSDATELQNRYGDSEIFSTVAGLVVGGADLVYNGGRAVNAVNTNVGEPLRDAQSRAVDAIAGSVPGWGEAISNAWNNRPVATGHEAWDINPPGNAPAPSW